MDKEAAYAAGRGCPALLARLELSEPLSAGLCRVWGGERRRAVLASPDEWRAVLPVWRKLASGRAGVIPALGDCHDLLHHLVERATAIRKVHLFAVRKVRR